MRRSAVKSELIRSVGYKPTARVLEVRYEDGTIFQYFDVPVYVFRRLKETNPGAWWTDHWNDYKYTQIS